MTSSETGPVEVLAAIFAYNIWLYVFSFSSRSIDCTRKFAAGIGIGWESFWRGTSACLVFVFEQMAPGYPATDKFPADPRGRKRLLPSLYQKTTATDLQAKYSSLIAWNSTYGDKTFRYRYSVLANEGFLYTRIRHKGFGDEMGFFWLARWLGKLPYRKNSNKRTNICTGYHGPKFPL